MPGIEGITVILIERIKKGDDPFGAPIYEEKETEIEDVLVSPINSDDLTTNTDLKGKKLVYQLAIPKGDTHDWYDCKVRFMGKTFKTVGYPLEGIEKLIPLRWNKKVTVELYG